MISEVIVKIIDSPIYILITIINLALIAAIVLAIIEIRIKKRIKPIKKSEYQIYIEDLKTLKSSKKKVKSRLDAINGIAKDFFKLAFNFNPDLTYSELIEKFQEKMNKKAASFCESMLITYYTKENLNEEKINFITSDLIRLISEEMHRNELKGKFQEEESKSRSLLSLIIPGLKAKKQIPQESTKNQPEKTLEDDVSKEILKEEVSDILSYKKRIEKIKEDIFSNKEAKDLIKKQIKSKEDLERLFNKNPEVYDEFKKIYSLIKQSHKKINNISEKIYNHSTDEQKRKLRQLIIQWHKEQESKLNKITNPFNQQIIELELLEKYFVKIIVIAKSLFDEEIE